MARAALVFAAAGALFTVRPASSTNSEEAAVRAALQHYLNGHSTGSAAEFKAGMHSQGTMYFVKDGALVTRSFPDFFAGAPGKPAADESKRRRRIDFVDITGTAAVAKITLDDG